MSERKKRNIIICSLCGVLLFMTVGYAAFNTLLDINGTTSITSNWEIKITNVERTNITNMAEEVNNPVWSELTASMEANLYQKGDSIEYDVTIENKGTLDAVLTNVEQTTVSNHDAIKITTSGYEKGETLSSKGVKIIKVKIEYNPDFNGVPEIGSSEVKISFTFEQLGKGEVIPDPDPIVDFETVSTTRSITVTPKIEPRAEITKYEYKLDTADYVEDSSTHIFDQITHNTEHNIQVKLTTKDGKEIESEVKSVSTLLLPSPSVTPDCSTSMTFPAECNGTYICSYTFSGGRNEKVTVTSPTINVYIGNWNQRVNILAEVSDGYNTTSDLEWVNAWNCAD